MILVLVCDVYEHIRPTQLLAHSPVAVHPTAAAPVLADCAGHVGRLAGRRAGQLAVQRAGRRVVDRREGRLSGQRRDLASCQLAARQDPLDRRVVDPGSDPTARRSLALRPLPVDRRGLRVGNLTINRKLTNHLNKPVGNDGPM